MPGARTPGTGSPVVRERSPSPILVRVRPHRQVWYSEVINAVLT
jgi:hypothetical protein